MNSYKLKAAFFILLASISYGSLGVIAKFAYADGVSANMLAVSQMFFGALFFGLYKIKKLPTFFQVSKRSIVLLGVGGAMSALTAFCYYRSLDTLAASVAIIMLFQFVWIGLALELAHKKRFPSRFEIVAVLLCYAGTYLSVGTSEATGGTLFGLFLGFISGAFFAIYIFFSSTYCLDEDSGARAFWIIFSAFLLSFALSFLWLDFKNIYSVIKWGAVCGVFGVFIPFYIYALFSPQIGAAATSIIGSAELPSALVLSVLILDEKLTAMQVLGSALVFLAIFVIFFGEAKAK